MQCNLKHQHSHIWSCMPHSVNPAPASSTFKGMKLVNSSLSCVLFWGCILFSLPHFSYPESLLWLLAHSYSTFLIPLPTFMNKILLQFSCISHMPPHRSLLPWTHISATQPQMPPHTSFQTSTEVAALGSSSWLFLPQEETEIATRNILPLRKK